MLITKPQSPKPCQHFSYFYWLSFYRSVKLHYRKIRVTCCIKGQHEENIFKNGIHRHGFVSHVSVNVLTKLHGKLSNLHTLLIHLKRRDSLKTSASFRLLKTYKHITPSQRNVSTWKAASQRNNRTPSVHSMQPWASRESDTVTQSRSRRTRFNRGQLWAKRNESDFLHR